MTARRRFCIDFLTRFCFVFILACVSVGIAAASGKVGALIAAISFNYIENDLHFFLFCGYASFLAAIVTMWAIPESSGLDVAELVRYLAGVKSASPTHPRSVV